MVEDAWCYTATTQVAQNFVRANLDVLPYARLENDGVFHVLFFGRFGNRRDECLEGFPFIAI